VHELSLSSAVVKTVVNHAAGRRVAVVNLRIGRMRQVVPATLAFSFELVARDTVCEGARLEIDHVEARLRCRACDHAWEVEAPSFRCPACSGSDVEVVSGSEFEIESIEVEVEEDACIAPR
jgi:hydrogenase nickel incorporation protein HypA/HybF